MDESEKDKTIKLIEYLRHLIALHSKVVYDLKDYDNILWFSDIPKQKGCFTQAWGISEDAPEIWLELKKRLEPAVPEIPQICEDWINKETLYQSDDLPEVYSTIPQIHETEVNGEVFVKTEYLELSDFPKVKDVWNLYLEKKWLPWMEEHKRWEQIQKVYTKLFEIHQQQQKLGEQFELVLGLGLLHWQLPNEQDVRRHLIIAKANLDFDHKSGRFTLTSDEEGAKLDIELNMLSEYQPTTDVDSIKNSFEAAEDNPWDRNIIDGVLSSLANIIGEGNGEYHAELGVDVPITTKPNIYFAPALILRKRSVRGLEIALNRIEELIQEGTTLPDWFSDLCEGEPILEDRRGQRYERVPEEDQTIYFPLPSNSQQRQILEKWQSTDGILVQGPPGTGKSLTIANLICHLLAKGHRILVTAKTPRALQVLHGLLPEKIMPLCVSLLGQGAQEREVLQQSVSRIHSREAEWEPLISEAAISDLEKKLKKKRSQKAEIESQIRKLREKDTAQNAILDGAYQGTTAKIATMLNEQKDDLEWFLDKANIEEPLAISQEELLKFRKELIFFKPELLQELSHSYVEPAELPCPDEIRKYVSKESSLKKELEEIKDLLDSRLEQMLLARKRDAIENLLGKIDILYAETKTVLNRPYDWIKTAVNEILSDRDTPWKDLERVMQNKLKGLKERAQKVDVQRLELGVDVDGDKLFTDAKRLKEYLDDEGRLGWWIFKPKIIREMHYLIEGVSIDGEKCTSINTLSKIIEHLEVKKDIEYLWNLCKDKINRIKGPLFLQVAHLEEVLEALSAAVALYDKMEIAKQAVKTIDGLQEPAWHSLNDVYKLCCTCRTILNQMELKDIRSKIDDIVFRIESNAKKPRMHPCISKIVVAIRKKDIIQYSNLLEKINELKKLSQRWEEVKKTRERIQKHFPELLKELLETPKDDIWEPRLRKFENAYKWACARDWLNDYLSTDNLPALYTKLKRYDSEISSLLAQLAAEKAWSFCLGRMIEEQSRNLKMFSRVRIPKTGKNVLRKRREAQKYLNNCKDAVPAWIMPLHRVYDTVTPSTDAFDVIIVDEASQCGQEALPLFFFSKKIIIVGDDKQISPMTVGIKENLIHQLIERFLSDFKYKETFEPKKSLFDQAFFRFPSRNHIRLREHFRCMPEIIRFSNDLCYSDQPLIPLKQFSSQRLQPLKRVYVRNGYREGSRNSVINKPEAEAIVESIVDCCSDDRYQDMTMGVIVLQGHAQDRLIESMLIKELNAEEIESRRLICGGPYSFQGDERDVIFLSMVAAPNERIGVLTPEDYVRRFNVAASRAKEQMWLFHSAELSDLGRNCLRRRLLSFFSEGQYIRGALHVCR